MDLPPLPPVASHPSGARRAPHTMRGPAHGLGAPVADTALGALLADRRGAQLVEYLLLVGLVALAALGGVRSFGGRATAKAEAHARCVETFSCGDGDLAEPAYALSGGVHGIASPVTARPAPASEPAPPAPANEDEDEDAAEEDDGDDCSGWSLCQIGDAASSVGDAAGAVGEAVWDDSGLDSVVTNTVDGVFWRTWDNVTNGGPWYEWPLDWFKDSTLAPLQVGGNVFQQLWSLPEWMAQSWEGRNMETTGADWALPPGGETVLFQRLPGERADITPADIVQGRVGTCVTLAGLGAIAAVSPETIRNAIRDNGDGTYTVTFHEQRMPGMIWDREWTTHEVTVDARVPVDAAGNPISAQAPYGELWPLIVEKAWAEYSGGYHRIDGDTGSALLEAVTGHTASFHEGAIDAVADRLPGSSPVLPSLDTLSSWHESGRAIITGKDGHMLYIRDVDAQTGTLTIGNPWGEEHTETLSYDEWKNGGEYVSVSVADTDASADD